MRPFPVLAVAFLLVTAGCSGVFGVQDTDSTVAPGLQNTPTQTESPSTTEPESQLPPGVTPDADDEVNERALYVAHDRVLDNRSVTWRSQSLLTNTTGAVLRWSTVTVWTNGSHQRYEGEVGGADPTTGESRGLEYEYWTNGSVTVSRFTHANGSVERSVYEGGPLGSFATVEAGRSVLEDMLTGTDLQYVGVEQRNGTLIHVLAGTSADARLTVRVTSAGVVRSLVSQTPVNQNGTTMTAVTRFRTYDVGTTTVERPPWAMNSTAQ